jgi:hypothetical protein
MMFSLYPSGYMTRLSILGGETLKLDAANIVNVY